MTGSIKSPNLMERRRQRPHETVRRQLRCDASIVDVLFAME